MKIALLGASGALGTRIKEHLCNVYSPENIILITREGGAGTSSFNEFINSDLTNVTNIVDVSTCKIGEYEKLITKLESYQHLSILHVSSVRAKSAGALDVYSHYKKNVLNLWRNSELSNVHYLYGDLFGDKSSLLGYWKFVKKPFEVYFISHRTLTIFNIVDVVKDYLDSKVNEGIQINKQLIVPKIIGSALFRLRVNKLFSKFFVVVI